MTEKIEYAKIRNTNITEIDIKSQRVKAGYSVRQMANLMRMDYAHYSRMERGIMAMKQDKYENFINIISNGNKN